ncbi:UvrD-helicase domain-containing protein [Geodermatophilus sp. CPCC 205761]|uniref:UvrD-helicase domain-containing protein n=1 Tax=Geodermatophilus sp. CPCC 205761 TaxID=2936597 RepID=UPI003EEA2D1A
MAEEPTLDESQRAVAEADADARLVVTAGAGQGKTEVVAARLRHLIEEERLSGTDDLLVLSFSRAAVAAVQGRVRGDSSLAAVTVRTFDSLASRLLLEAGEDVEGLRFDPRIRAATELLEKPDSDVPTVDLLRHVVVDEVQDLVGDRAELVLALLRRLDADAGFTVLGDPLQAVFDFVLDESKSSMTSLRLLDRLRADLGAVDLQLEHHYRAQTSETRAVVGLGDRMRTARSGRSRLNKVRHHVDGLPSVGTLDDLVRLLPRWTGRTALLCDTNGQAMLVSRALDDLSVLHRLRRPAEQLSVPSWVAVVLAESPTRHVDRATFDGMVDESGVTVPETAWRLLKATERRRRTPRELDLVELAAHIAAGDVPVELADAGDADVVVSTIHRAKGLEFDNVVVVVQPERQAEEPDDAADDERARELYVAVSRARCRLAIVQSPSTRGLYRDRRPPCRWVHAYKSWQTNAFEFQLRDVERKRPYGDEPESAQEVQRLLGSELGSGGLPVEGRLDTRRSTASAPVYSLSVAGRPVAVTSAGFAAALTQRLDRVWRNHPGPPAALQALRTDGVETAAGPPMAGDRLGVGRWGLWLAPRVGGLAQLHYERGERG